MIIKGVLLFLFGTALVSANLYKSRKYAPQLKSVHVSSPRKYGQPSAVVASELRKSTNISKLNPVRAPKFESVRKVPLKHWRTKNSRPVYVNPETLSTRKTQVPSASIFKPKNRIVKKYKQKVIHTDPLLTFPPLRTSAEEKKEILLLRPLNNIEETFVNQLPLTEEKIEFINPPAIQEPLLVIPDSSLNSGTVHLNHNLATEPELTSSVLTNNNMGVPCTSPLLFEDQVEVDELGNPIVLPQSAMLPAMVEPSLLSVTPEIIKYETFSSPIELPLTTVTLDLGLPKPKKPLVLNKPDSIIAVPDEQLLSNKDLKPAVIPSAPELTIDVEEMPLIEAMKPLVLETDMKPIVTPVTPQLPPLTIPEVVIKEYVEDAGLPQAITSSLSETFLEPISIPNPPKLLPQVSPEVPIIEISKKPYSFDCISDVSKDSVSSLADEAQMSAIDLGSIEILKAPDLPPFVPVENSLTSETEILSEVEESTNEGILLDDDLTDTYSKPIIIPDALELPQLLLPEAPPKIPDEEKPETDIQFPETADNSAELLVPKIISEHQVIPEPPQLSSINLPEIVTKNKVMQLVPLQIAIQNTNDSALCEKSISREPLLIPTVPELPPLHLPETFPASSTEEDKEYLGPPSEISQNTYLSDIQDFDSKPQFNNIPAAPELPAIDLIHTSISLDTDNLENIDVTLGHDLPKLDMKPLPVSDIQTLLPLTLPEAPITIITEEFTKASESLPGASKNSELTPDIVEFNSPRSHFLPLSIPEAPVLPPFIMPKLPPLIYSETPLNLLDSMSDSNKTDETFLTSLTDKDIISKIPKSPELPPLTLPEPPVKLLIKKSHSDPRTNSLPQTPIKHVIEKLPDISFPEICAEQPLIEEINLKPINKPQAPLLPLFKLPELLTIEEDIGSNSYLLENPIVEVIKPLWHPKIPKHPPLTLPISTVHQKGTYYFAPEVQENDQHILCAEVIEDNS